MQQLLWKLILSSLKLLYIFDTLCPATVFFDILEGFSVFQKDSFFYMNESTQLVPNFQRERETTFDNFQQSKIYIFILWNELRFEILNRFSENIPPVPFF